MSRASELLAQLRQRPLPTWYGGAKFGIFIHWSLAAVPGWAPRSGDISEVVERHFDDFMALAPYADWYENAIKLADSPSAQYHREHWGGRPYDDFRETYNRALDQWDPAGWADLFARAGARYVVLVTKHHDGYSLWPSDVPNDHRAGWCTDRDVVGDLAAAVRSRGLRFGVYYSGGIDWSFNPKPVRNVVDFICSVPGGSSYADYAERQVRELIDRYTPDVVWNDVSWPGSAERQYALFRDYYATVPEGVINDRWIRVPGWVKPAPVRALARWWIKRSIATSGRAAAPPPAPHRDFRTPEYASFDEVQQEKWESTRGMAHSFGYNRNEDPADMLSSRELIQSFADIVSKNGNLLLNVGPRGEDAKIPDEQAALLLALGGWLDRNGDAIFDTSPWKRAEGKTACGLEVRFTSKGERLFATLLGTPSGPEVRLLDLRVDEGRTIRLLGDEPVAWRQEGPDIVIEAAQPPVAAPAHVFEISPANA